MPGSINRAELVNVMELIEEVRLATPTAVDFTVKEAIPLALVVPGEVITVSEVPRLETKVTLLPDSAEFVLSLTVMVTVATEVPSAFVSAGDTAIVELVRFAAAINVEVVVLVSPEGVVILTTFEPAAVDLRVPVDTPEESVELIPESVFPVPVAARTGVIPEIGFPVLSLSVTVMVDIAFPSAKIFDEGLDVIVVVVEDAAPTLNVTVVT